jgi:hypothetical protein
LPTKAERAAARKERYKGGHSTKSKSPYTRTVRMEKAFTFYRRGFKVADVARELNVHRDTAAAYKRLYDERVATEAAQNPELLTDVLKNTYRSLEELDDVRQEVWRNLRDRERRELIECEHCGEEQEHVFKEPISDQARASYLNTLLKAHDQRTKLFGLMGVKQEVFAVFQQVDAVQRAMLEWMVRELCAEDRAKLATFLEVSFPEYLPAPAVPALMAGDDEDILEGELV